ncbi:thiamine phosphate synthase [Brevundimonas sp.]|uniref:thiamine phosphate synthase n=1 Tax=Brevundimonas sp. TaxID=1871086 RepID=UPI002B8062C0|nr:thiamine phosphate synthase [Brevundimonas sp.]HWQ86405.1 thiamine phosphate synthase [Brevundimonas sp.]
MNRSDAETLWDTARVLARDAGKVSRASAPRALPPLLFFTDPARTPRPWETAARLPAGAAVVFRHFGQADARKIALRLREITATRGVLLLIGLDADLAGAVGADGLHLPERALDQARSLSEARPDWLITGAAHAGSALDTAHLHARILSPLFVAGGASSATPPLGLTEFRALAASAACPVYALGGIDAENAQGLIGSGACGLAGVSAIQAAFNA